MLESLFKTSSIYFGGLVAGKLFTTIAFILLGRILPLADFGKGVLFITLASVITYFGDFGMNQWYQKEVENHDKKTLFQTIFFARLWTLGLSIIIAFLFLTVTHTFSFPITILFLFMLIAEGLLSIADGYYLEKKEGLKVALKPVSKNSVLLLGMVLTLSTFHFETSIYLLVIGSYLTLIWFFPWQLLKNIVVPRLAEIKTTIGGGSKYALLTITSFAYSRGDSILINYLLNSGALGLYSGAYRFLESVALIPTAIAHNLFPISAKEKGINLTQVMKITSLMMLCGVGVMIITFLCAPFLIITLLGPQFAPAVDTLRIFSIVMLLFFINGPLATVVQSSNSMKQFLPFGIGNTILNLGLNILLIPVWGINGAAVSMGITEATGLIINLYFIKKIYA